MKLHVESASFCTDNSRTSRLSIFFTVFLTTKSLSQNISITLLQISFKLHENRGGYWRKKLPWMILEEQLPLPRNTAVSKIGNSVISLLCQLRCHCNPDENELSFLSNTTEAAIFPKLCLWRRSLCSNLGGSDPEKLYLATLTQLWTTRPRSQTDNDISSLLKELSKRKTWPAILVKNLDTFVSVSPVQMLIWVSQWS